MDNKTLTELNALLNSGEVNLLKDRLEVYLTDGDLDARFINTRFSIDNTETGECFDRRVLKELQTLSELHYPEAMFELAYKYKYGIDIEKNIKKSDDLMLRAVILGHLRAREIMAIELEERTGQYGLFKYLQSIGS